MIEITKQQWNNIHKDYKGKWAELSVKILDLPNG